jgi:hypothetical protein
MALDQKEAIRIWIAMITLGCALGFIAVAFMEKL